MRKTVTLETALLTQCQKYQLNGRRLYLGCSGGRDSLSLAWACLMLYQQNKLQQLPTLLHVNHHWQAANDAWALQVVDFAHRYGFDCQVLDVPTPDSENTARQVRYQAMFATMVDNGVLLLAHHSDDQAETMLMRLINGTSLAGLVAMRVWQDRQYHDKKLTLFRPWLLQSRLAITNYAHAHRLPYVDDPTNTEGGNARSVIRNKLAPILSDLNPQAMTNIARTSHLLADAKAITDTAVMNALSKLKLSVMLLGDRQQVLDSKGLICQSQAMQRAILTAFVKGECVYGADFALIERLIDLCWRTDNDHRTQYYWQSPDTTNLVQAYVFCRYMDGLYRYRADFWERLTKPLESDWQIDNHQAKLHFDGVSLCLYGVAIYQIKKLSKQDKVLVGRHHLAGKKLYQALKIAPWFRHHLWLVTYDCAGRQGECLVAMGQVWRLDDCCDLPRLKICSL